MKPADAFREAALNFEGNCFSKEQLKSKYFELVDGGENNKNFDSYFYDFKRKAIKGLKIACVGTNSFRTECVENTRNDEHVATQERRNGDWHIEVITDDVPISLYQFSYRYLIKQTERLFSINEEAAKVLINSYFIPNVCEPYTFEKMLEETVQSIQTASRNINVINYLKNKDELFNAFNGYDVRYICNHSSEELFEKCVSLIGEEIINSKSTWLRMINGLKDNAAIMSRFATPDEYREFISGERFIRATGVDFVSYQSENKKKPARLYSNGFGIAQFGPAITPNYMKEIGLGGGKPDTHTMSLFLKIGLVNSLTDYESFKNNLFTEVQKAVECGCNDASTYKFDKIIWLICSGFYYRHRNSKYGGGAKRLKNPYINSVYQAVERGIVII